MTISPLRRRITVVAVAAAIAITGCVGLDAAVNAAPSLPTPQTSPSLLPDPEPQPSPGVVVQAAEDPCAPQRLTALAAPESCV